MNWYYAEGTQQLGPLSEADFQQLVASGKITDATLVWREGMAQWQPYGQVRAASPPGTATLLPAGGPGPSFTPAFTPLNDDAGARAARDRVNGPAIGLIATAVLGFLGSAWSVLQLIVTKGSLTFPPGGPGLDPEMIKMMETYYLPIAGASVLFGLVINGLILFAGLKMKKLESFGLVIAGTILAMLPCSCPVCCVGIPVGIWALVVMNSADVKPYFD